jgi:hypothetical protein
MMLALAAVALVAAVLVVALEVVVVLEVLDVPLTEETIAICPYF